MSWFSQICCCSFLKWLKFADSYDCERFIVLKKTFLPLYCCTIPRVINFNWDSHFCQSNTLENNNILWYFSLIDNCEPLLDFLISTELYQHHHLLLVLLLSPALQLSLVYQSISITFCIDEWPYTKYLILSNY